MSTPEQIARLENAGAEVFVVGEARVDVSAVLESLHSQGIRKLMVEGGGNVRKIVATQRHGEIGAQHQVHGPH